MARLVSCAVFFVAAWYQGRIDQPLCNPSISEFRGYEHPGFEFIRLITHLKYTCRVMEQKETNVMISSLSLKCDELLVLNAELFQK